MVKGKKGAAMVWNVDPVLFQFGFATIRWYGILFALAFIVGVQIMKLIFKYELVSTAALDRLFIYVMTGTILGARLGHCLFYEPEVYLRDPIRILYIWQGGLASHGGAVGILIALKLFVRAEKSFCYLWLLDRISIPVSLAAVFIRIGNFFNSEIIGRPTDLPWAVIFQRHDSVPRHPTQIYEALVYLLTFFLLVKLYRTSLKQQGGAFFGIFLIMIFGGRFLIEFLKESQVVFEKSMLLDLGQLLSIPAILAGLVLLVSAIQKKENKTWDKL